MDHYYSVVEDGTEEYTTTSLLAGHQDFSKLRRWASALGQRNAGASFLAITRRAGTDKSGLHIGQLMSNMSTSNYGSSYFK
jgi:hypothetical protein